MKRTLLLFTALAALVGALFSPRASGEPLAEGAELPTVSQINQDGEKVALKTLGETGYLLVFFYPKADTPGCTKQACSVRDSFAELSEKGVKVLGASADGKEAQKAFKDKFKLPYDLLADADGTVSEAFGVPKRMGFTARQAFLFKDGKLLWRDLSAATDKQAADVLAVLAKE